MLGQTFAAELQAKELATGLALVLPGVSWHVDDAAHALDPLPAGLSQLQIDAIQEVVAAHVYTPPLGEPDYSGFLHWLDSNLSFAQIQAFHQCYGMFIAWCQFGNAGRIRECILDAQANHPELMSPAVYALFRNGVQTYHLPMELP